MKLNLSLLPCLLAFAVTTTLSQAPSSVPIPVPLQLSPMPAIGQQQPQLTEETAWSHAVSEGTVAAYLEFAKQYAASSHVKTTSGTLRARYWLKMGDLTASSGGVTADFGGQGILVTVARSDAFTMLKLVDAISQGVIRYKLLADVPRGTIFRIPTTTFEYTTFEMQGPCLAGDPNSTDVNLSKGIVVEPTDFVNASIVMSADGKRLLAWDLKNATVADQPDVSHATYPDSARADKGGLNPEKQTATYTQTRN